MMYQRHNENIEKGIFQKVGKYGIPKLEPVEYEACKFLPYNYAKGHRNKSQAGVHFFLDDYQFTRLWNGIDRYIPLLKQFKYVLSPDFSMYVDFPEALQIYNQYRKHWLGAYMQYEGIPVIPTISWSDERSFDWCFEGEPTQGVVAVSSVGAIQGKKTKERFIHGYREMLERLQPKQILFYGIVPEECQGNIVPLPAFQERFQRIT